MDSEKLRRQVTHGYAFRALDVRVVSAINEYLETGDPSALTPATSYRELRDKLVRQSYVQKERKPRKYQGAGSTMRKHHNAGYQEALKDVYEAFIAGGVEKMVQWVEDNMHEETRQQMSDEAIEELRKRLQ